MNDIYKNYRKEMNYFLESFNETDDVHTPVSIRNHVTEINKLFKLDPQIIDQICREVEANYDITQSTGFSLKKDFVPWILNKEIDFHYWDRYERYLLRQGRASKSLRNLRNITREITDFCGNPDGEYLKRRGMVIGDVQAGKTENYTGVICRAADAGYKFFIILTGLTNLLRTQTQGRLDLGFIGKKAIWGAPYEAIGAAKLENNPQHPTFFTTIDSDFNLKAAKINNISFNTSDPIIFVTKKNVATLRNIYEWLRSNSRTTRVPYPLLLIDDEADNASINTASDPDRTTKINEGIRRVLGKFDKSCYLGYTATPYANIFIDPLKDDEMEMSDLFPADFIKLLSPPSNYIGPNYYFSENEQKIDSQIIEINDHEEILPLNHKIDHNFSVLPESLKKALRLFVVFRAIRILQQKEQEHSSMMVNASRFNAVQSEISYQIEKYITELKDAVSFYSKLSEEEASKNEYLHNLRQDYIEEYKKLESTSYSFNSWIEIQRNLEKAIRPIIVVTVNMRGGKLSYEKNKQNGLQVIAVGGFALSRGLTLEGLSISYSLRKASAYDSLMQMARWFGYRDGYTELCRLFMTAESKEHYTFVTEASQELKDELKVMDFAELTPLEFGLKVRHHSSRLRITALNKMRNAQQVRYAFDPRGRAKEGAYLHNSQEINQKNRKNTKEFIESLGEISQNGLISKPEFFWENVNAGMVLDFINSFDLPDQNTEFARLHGNKKKSLMQLYVEDRFEELKLWDVALAPNKSPRKGKIFSENEIISGKTFYVRFRGGGFLLNEFNVYKVNSSRRVAEGNGADAKHGLRYEQIDEIEEPSEVMYNYHRVKPLLLIQIIRPKLSEKNPQFKLFDSNCPTISVFLPGKTSVPEQEETYYRNTVSIMIDEAELECDEDEEIDFYQ